jgi:hypothetical protein
MKRLLAAPTLALLLCAPALAGDIPTSGTPAPPPSDGTAQSSTTTLRDIPLVVSVDELSSSALSVLLTAVGVLSV